MKTTRAPRAATVEEKPELSNEAMKKRRGRHPIPPVEVDAAAIMTLREVAEYLRCSYSTIYRLAKNRKIPAFPIGHSLRCRRSEIEKWINDRQVKPEDAGEHEDKPKSRPPKFSR
jgi:excisionase family DNA binding protein